MPGKRAQAEIGSGAEMNKNTGGNTMLLTSRRFDADVVVCGGGPAGFAAALAAARDGKRAILLEMRESLGGLYTNGYITGMAGYVDGYAKEFIERMDKAGHALVRPHLPSIDPEAGKLMMEQMVLAAGCRILYGAHVADCEVRDGRIVSAIVYCKSGKIEVTGRVFIDCTGDADLAFAAGVPTETSAADFLGLCQSVTMGFRLAYVDLNKYRAAEREYMSNRPEGGSPNLMIQMQKTAIANGDLPEMLSPGNLVYEVPNDSDLSDKCVTLDATHSFDCRNDDIVDLTRQIVDQRRKIFLFLQYLRKYIPGFEKAQLVGVANMNGLRDSRRIVGEYVLRDIDVAGGSKFPDGIALFPEVLDTHMPTPGLHMAMRHVHYREPFGSAHVRPAQDCNDFNMHPFVPAEPDSYELRPDPRDWCEIPYRSLVAVGVDNLLVAGRCYSAEFHALGGTRVIATCMSMGQAAGHAASLCVDRKILPREVDGKELRALLVKEGAHLDGPPMGYWEKMRNAEGELVYGFMDGVQVRSKNPPPFL